MFVVPQGHAQGRQSHGGFMGISPKLPSDEDPSLELLEHFTLQRRGAWLVKRMRH